jgi:DNA uptake protein ComE-like DNA-binding protein
MKLNLLLCSLVGAVLVVGVSATHAAHHQPKAPAAAASSPATAPSSSKKTAPARPVDLNNASVAELKTLPGVGDAEAERIVKGRPYLSKANAFANGVLPESMYETLKGRIVVKEPKSPALKAAVRQATGGASRPGAGKP